MSTVKEHLGLLLKLATNSGIDRHWNAQACLLVEAHLEELIGLAGGASLEEWVRLRYGPFTPDEQKVISDAIAANTPTPGT